MKLEADGQPVVEDPQREQVQQAVSSLTPAGPTFLILSRAGMSFVQVAVAGPDRFRLECRDGDRQPLLSARTLLSHDDVARVLEAYRQGGDAWRAEIEWQPVGPTANDWDKAGLFFAAIGLALMLVCFFASQGLRTKVLGLDPYLCCSLAYALFLPSIIIDLRRFRTLTARNKVRAVGGLVIAVLIVLSLIAK